MQGNIIGGSGINLNNSLFPIYQQLVEPSEKKGLWIKSDENIKDVYFQTDDVRDYELINDLPYNFNRGKATSIGSNIYLFGGEDDYDNNAYKYNSIEGTYSKLSDVPPLGLTDRTAISSKSEIYIINNNDELYKYNISEDTYTKLSTSIYFRNTKGCGAVLIEDNIYVFGSSETDYNNRAMKYNITNDERTLLEYIPNGFSAGSAIAINDNEIILLGVGGINNTYGIYKYNISENEYYIDRVLLGYVRSNTKINNFAYIIERISTTSEYYKPILTKYNLKNNSFYQYGKTCVSLEGNYYDTFQVANANNDLYVLTDLKLYKAKIVADYKGDGIYVISQETSLSKELDVNNILDVKKIVNEEEQQNVIAYIGDGESWKLLNSSDVAQNNNTLEYALSFKEEN